MKERPNKNRHILELISELLPEVIEWMDDVLPPEGFERDEEIAGIRNDLIKVLCYGGSGQNIIDIYSLDGYKLAKELEDRCNWFGIDTDLVMILNKSIDFLNAIHFQKVKNWVRANGIKLEHKVGDYIKWSPDDYSYRISKVIEVSDTLGYYIIYLPFDKEFTVPAEKVIGKSDKDKESLLLVSS